MSGTNCLICSGPMMPEPVPDTFRCPSCGLFASTLPVRVNESTTIDEASREKALKPLRTKNFDRIFRELSGILASDAEVLDVGCGHGWFLEAAVNFGYNATGMEPDTEIARHAFHAGAPVIQGFFPGDLAPGRRFSAITFNDVLEHLPRLDDVLAQIDERLLPGGVVVINIPVSDGAIFRISRMIAYLGYTAPLSRLWQVGLPSPHLTYFSSNLLRKFMARKRFVLLKSCSLQSVSVDGLYRRIRADQNLSAGSAAMLYCIALILVPMLKVIPSDARLFVFRKDAAE